MKKIPKFKNEEDVARFWKTHNFKGYVGDTKEAEIGFVKRPKKTVALNLGSRRH